MYLVCQYLRDVYQVPAIARTVYAPHIRLMFDNYPEKDIGTPAGPFVDYAAPHDRNRQF